MPSWHTPEGQSAQGSEASLLVSIGCVVASVLVDAVVLVLPSLPPLVEAEPPPLRLLPSPPPSAAHAHTHNTIHSRPPTNRASTLTRAAVKPERYALRCTQQSTMSTSYSMVAPAPSMRTW